MAKKFKKTLAMLLTMCMVMSMVSVGAFAEEPEAEATAETVTETKNYVDVLEEDWFKDAVKYVTEKEYMDGVDTDLFAPLEGTTRAMVVTVLYRLETEATEVEPASFTDLDPVNGAWYMDAVNWASANGIALGYEDGSFRPMNVVTREEIATFFYRWAQYKNYNVSLTADLSAYTDSDTVQDYAKAPMAWAVAVGLIKGVTEDTLCPAAHTKRAETATILYRLTGDPKVVATVTGTELPGDNEDLEDPDTPLVETPETPEPTRTPVHVHTYTYGEWTADENGTHTRTGTCSCGTTTTESHEAAGEWTATEDGTQHTRTCETCGLEETEDHVFADDDWALDTEDETKHSHTCSVCGYKVSEEHTFENGVCTVCGAEAPVTAESVTKAAVEALNEELKNITGNGGAQLVTAELDGDKLAVTLDTNAIKGAGQSFEDDLLNGLVTKLKAALDSYFGEYTLSVEGNDVYSNTHFDNTALKAALYDVASGFFVKLAGMTADGNGVYTYKTVDAVVAGADNDRYSFNVAIQLKGTDVEKVQKMASILEKHLSMTTMTAAEVKAKYGIEVTGENDFIVVGMEMPDKLMQDINSGEYVDASTAKEVFERTSVATLLRTMATTDVENLIGSGVSEVNTVIGMVNDNTNLINKVLSKITAVRIATTNGAVDLFKTSANFIPVQAEGVSEWTALVAGIGNMLSDAGAELTPGQFATTENGKYLVPITVTIDLESSMDFKADETVLFVLNIPIAAAE